MPPQRDFRLGPLDESNVSSSPTEQLMHWIAEAHAAEAIEPDAMCLSTVGADGRPSSRFVLLRGLDERGLTFYTNYESRKGRELTESPWAAAAFWWGVLERQVRVEGRVERVPAAESDAYFYRRPMDSRFSAAASPQSRPIRDRAELEAMVASVVRSHPDGNVPRPSYWGGLRLIPDRFEFWQGRPGRLHDRLAYEPAEGEWQITRLAP